METRLGTLLARLFGDVRAYPLLVAIPYFSCTTFQWSIALLMRSSDAQILVVNTWGAVESFLLLLICLMCAGFRVVRDRWPRWLVLLCIMLICGSLTLNWYFAIYNFEDDPFHPERMCSLNITWQWLGDLWLH